MTKRRKLTTAVHGKLRGPRGTCQRSPNFVWVVVGAQRQDILRARIGLDQVSVAKAYAETVRSRELLRTRSISFSTNTRCTPTALCPRSAACETKNSSSEMKPTASIPSSVSTDTWRRGVVVGGGVVSVGDIGGGGGVEMDPPFSPWSSWSRVLCCLCWGRTTPRTAAEL